MLRNIYKKHRSSKATKRVHLSDTFPSTVEPQQGIKPGYSDYETYPLYPWWTNNSWWWWWWWLLLAYQHMTIMNNVQSLIKKQHITPHTNHTDTDNGKRHGKHKLQGSFRKISNRHRPDSFSEWLYVAVRFRSLWAHHNTPLEYGSTLHGYDTATLEAAYQNNKYQHWYWYNVWYYTWHTYSLLHLHISKNCVTAKYIYCIFT